MGAGLSSMTCQISGLHVPARCAARTPVSSCHSICRADGASLCLPFNLVILSLSWHDAPHTLLQRTLCTALSHHVISRTSCAQRLPCCVDLPPISVVHVTSMLPFRVDHSAACARVLKVARPRSGVKFSALHVSTLRWTHAPPRCTVSACHSTCRTVGVLRCRVMRCHATC